MTSHSHSAVVGTEACLAVMAAADLLLKRYLFGPVGFPEQTVWQSPWFKADAVLVAVLLLLTAIAGLKKSLWGAELDLLLLSLRCACQVCRIGGYLFK